MKPVSSGPRGARPQDRPAAHPIGPRHSLRSNRASDGRQGPEPQAYAVPVVKFDRRPKEKKSAFKQQEGLKQNAPRFLHLNSELRQNRPDDKAAI